jgi:hypothetical protein
VLQDPGTLELLRRNDLDALERLSGELTAKEGRVTAD